MIQSCQKVLIRWVLDPLYHVKRRVPEKTWSMVIALSIFGMIVVEFLNGAGITSRYLHSFVPFCLLLGLIILAGLSSEMKPVAFSPVMACSWGGLTLFMLLSGTFVERSVLADTLLWLVAFPVFYVVWGNRKFYELAKPVIAGVYLSFTCFFAVTVLAYPVTGARYSSLFLNLNGLAMYASGVFITALTDILTQKRFSGRMLLADGILGLAGAFCYYTSSRAGKFVEVLCACVAFLLLLIAGGQKLHRLLLHYFLPAVLALLILIPSTAWVINGINATVGWNAEVPEETDPTSPVETSTDSTVPSESTQPLADTQQALEDISEYSDKRTDQVADGLDGFTTGRVELWGIYLKEIGLLGNPVSKQLLYADGQTVIKSAHNTLLQMAYEYGAPAAICFLIFNIVSGIRALIYALRRRTLDYSLFPVIAAVAYGAYYLVEKVIYAPTSILLLLYLLTQTALSPRGATQEYVAEIGEGR